MCVISTLHVSYWKKQHLQQYKHVLLKEYELNITRCFIDVNKNDKNELLWFAVYQNAFSRTLFFSTVSDTKLNTNASDVSVPRVPPLASEQKLNE